jgi:TolB-like protein
LLYVFEQFALDTGRRELRRDDGLISLEPKVFDLLAYLIANRDRVIGKDDLIAAIWDGRIVSESALTTCINAARVALGDSGEAQRFIKTLPRKGIRFVGEVQEQSALPASSHPQSTRLLSLPDKPSIAVLPFLNLSGDPQQDYFADGIVEDLITSLSRIRWLFVIARNSSFTYKGRAVDVKDVGRDLGVRYVLEGSIRRSGNRIRVAGQLIDAATGTNLWADRFDSTVEDLFELQDQVTETVIGAIAPKLEQAEIDRAKRKPTGRMDAYDYFLRGMSHIHKITKEDATAALELFQQAISLDEEYAAAYAMASFCYNRRQSQGWMIDRAREVSNARRLARLAVRFGREDAVALAYASFTLAFVGREIDDAATYINRAVSLNPNLAVARSFSGWIKVWFGEPDLALEQFNYAMRLSPVDPFMPMMLHGSAHALFFMGRHEEATERALLALRDEPNMHGALRIGVASAAQAGRTTEAANLLARLRTIDPALRVSNLRNTLGPYRHREPVALYEDALRKAGLPD